MANSIVARRAGFSPQPSLLQYQTRKAAIRETARLPIAPAKVRADTDCFPERCGALVPDISLAGQSQPGKLRPDGHGDPGKRRVDRIDDVGSVLYPFDSRGQGCRLVGRLVKNAISRNNPAYGHANEQDQNGGNQNIRRDGAILAKSWTWDWACIEVSNYSPT